MPKKKKKISFRARVSVLGLEYTVSVLVFFSMSPHSRRCKCQCHLISAKHNEDIEFMKTYLAQWAKYFRLVLQRGGVKVVKKNNST